jgi:hypothetical protein
MQNELEDQFDYGLDLKILIHPIPNQTISRIVSPLPLIISLKNWEHDTKWLERELISQ